MEEGAGDYNSSETHFPPHQTPRKAGKQWFWWALSAVEILLKFAMDGRRRGCVISAISRTLIWGWGCTATQVKGLASEAADVVFFFFYYVNYWFLSKAKNTWDPLPEDSSQQERSQLVGGSLHAEHLWKNKQTKTRHQTGLAFLSKGDKHVPGEPCKFPCLSNSPELPSWEQVSSPCPPDSWLSLSWCKPPQLSPPSPLQLLPNAWSTSVPQVLSQLVPTSCWRCFCPTGTVAAKLLTTRAREGTITSGDKPWRGHF